MKTSFADDATTVPGYFDLASVDLTAASIRLLETVLFFWEEAGTSTNRPVAALRPSTAGLVVFLEAESGFVAMRGMWLRRSEKTSKTEGVGSSLEQSPAAATRAGRGIARTGRMRRCAG